LVTPGNLRDNLCGVRCAGLPSKVEQTGELHDPLILGNRRFLILALDYDPVWCCAARQLEGRQDVNLLLA
jgi:hypothetical protein